MMTDRTTKLLLVCIALALWGLLMRPTFTPMSVKAEGSSSGQLAVVGEGQNARVFLLDPGNRLYRFSSNDLSVQAREIFDPATQTSVHHAP